MELVRARARARRARRDDLRRRPDGARLVPLRADRRGRRGGCAARPRAGRTCCARRSSRTAPTCASPVRAAADGPYVARPRPLRCGAAPPGFGQPPPRPTAHAPRPPRSPVRDACDRIAASPPGWDCARSAATPPSRRDILPAKNFAARAGRWSAAHRKTAIFGWLAFVVVAFVIGGKVGTTDARPRRTWASATPAAPRRSSTRPSPRSPASRSSSRARPRRRRTRPSAPPSATSSGALEANRRRPQRQVALRQGQPGPDLARTVSRPS